MNVENETKQTKAYILCLFSVYAVGTFSAHFFQELASRSVFSLPAILPGKSVRKMRAMS